MAVYKFKTKPDPYQRDALIRAIKLKRFGVFFQQRVGKTKTAIDFMGALHVGKGFTRFIVSCPAGAEGVWSEQLKEHLGYSYSFVSLPQTDKARAKLADTKPDRLTVLCVSHDTLYTALKHLQKWNPQAVIFDEIHAMKDPTTKRSRASYKLVKDLDYVLGLTGTPIPKRPLDVFGIWKVLRPEVFGTSITKFRDQYCIMGGFMGKEVIGYKNTRELSRKISEYSIRVLRKDVMEEPKVEYVVVPVDLEPSAKELYNDLKKTFIAELNEHERVTADVAGVRIMRLQQLCGGFLPADSSDPDEKKLVQVSSAKKNLALNLIRNIIEQDEKVVVFFRFVAELELMANELAKKGISALMLYGKTPKKSRDAIISSFQNDSYYKVILVQEHVGSMAISLDAAHINIYYSMTYSLLDFQQSRDRVMGRGQTKDVTNYLLAIRNSVDYKIVQTLKNDEDLSTSISDKWRWLMD